MFTPVRLALFGLSTGAAVILGLLFARPAGHHEKLLAPRLSVQPAQIYADGNDVATLVIEAPGAAGAARVSIRDNLHAAEVGEVVSAGNGSGWHAQIRAGVMPGRPTVRVDFSNLPPATVELAVVSSNSDSFGDGTPDFLRLDGEDDRRAFRRWFTYLAEAQYFQEPANRPMEINDCAALIRYAYREALHAHESGWAELAHLPVVPPFGPVAKYQYPYTPLGAALFRVTEGPYRPSDLSSGAFSQFADARALWRFNTHLVGRDLSAASPGDLLFFRQDSGHMPYHSMIYLGESQLRQDGNRYLLYHTGPGGADPGEIRRLTTEELLNFPRPEWRPRSSNPNFLGVLRWNILRKASDPDDARHF
ncbi:MAG TPA: DUF1175 domain-containing protein [Bryobacteraceae bacterium]|nr:DUF1175 domain-containing protein [Bryobacteraceae bacterium]